MRLVCPNCSAQYEIDGSMIPDEGRDVQCSNCGHTWFELPPPPADFGDAGAQDFEDTLVADEAPEADFDTDEDEIVEAEVDTPEDVDAPEDEDFDAPEDTDDRVEASAEDIREDDRGDEDRDDDSDSDDTTADDDATEDDDDLSTGIAGTVAAAAAAAALEDDNSDEFDAPEVAASSLTPRRPADAASLDILREEAERELSQRRAPPSSSIETQTDLGLDEIQNRKSPSRALRARMAHLKMDEPKPVETPEEAPKPEPEATKPQYRDSTDDEAEYVEPRRDLLPDIDEINSTLKPARRREAEARERSGFLAGFVLMLLLTLALILAYAMAPALARMFPGMENTLIDYVDGANAVRDWMQGLFGG